MTQAEGHSVTAAAGGAMGDTDTQEWGVTEALGGVGPGLGAGHCVKGRHNRRQRARTWVTSTEPDGAPEPAGPILRPWAPVRGPRQGRPLCRRAGRSPRSHAGARGSAGRTGSADVWLLPHVASARCERTTPNARQGPAGDVPGRPRGGPFAPEESARRRLRGRRGGSPPLGRAGGARYVSVRHRQSKGSKTQGTLQLTMAPALPPPAPLRPGWGAAPTKGHAEGPTLAVACTCLRGEP